MEFTDHPADKLLPSGLLFLLLTACTPHVDDAALQGLSSAVRAPVEAAHMDLLSEQRAVEQARGQEAEARDAQAAAERALERCGSSCGDRTLRAAELDWARHMVERCRLEAAVADARVTLARARHELAKARLVEEQNLPLAERLSMRRFEDEERDARAELNRRVLQLTGLRAREEQLAAALRAERKKAAGP